MVSIYLRKGEYWLNTEAKTTMGIFMAVEPTKHLPGDASAIQLGEAVLELQAHQERIVEHPSDWKKYRSPLLEATNCSSWKTFVGPRPLLISVDPHGSTYIAEFHEFDGKGFVPTNPRSTAIAPESAGVAGIGQVVLDLLAKQLGKDS